ncbi:DNA polymerase IV [Erysipelothrix inopinata]|uniref:DNA polymerase IV n=1 Tax=Erysipelothrix inopinata TaxID=225084 RepID=A0A7G9RXL0_9FIRM|nr:DNA polymerase IV [Erysipelothrix inopinata]QNN60335.1 DNA polymerase IV [Erysipelothrix inopinata]
MAVILHIDINAFYASAHAVVEPELAGKPLVVCSNHRGSVITTASYEARKFGINSAMPLSYAQTLCRDLVVVPIDFSLYQDLSSKFMNIIRSYSTLMQPASIDECYVDVTEKIKEYERPLDLAYEIQTRVYRELKLPISIGVAPNKFLAKMASDMEKPKGITVLRIREVQSKLWQLPIEDMHGIGSKTVPKLQKMGIKTIGDLAQANEDSLRNTLGVNTQNFINKANGIDSSPIETDTTAKSIGQSKTFTHPMVELDEIRNAILFEIKEIERRLLNRDMVGKTITFSIRLQNYKTAARSITLDEPTQSSDVIFEKVMGLYDEFDGLDGVTFISISLSNLVYKDEIIEQLNIFDDLTEPTVNDIISRLNQELKQDVFKTPRSLLEKNSK